MSTVTVQLKFLKGTLYLLKNKFQFRLQWTPQIYKIMEGNTLVKCEINYFLFNACQFGNIIFLGAENIL